MAAKDKTETPGGGKGEAVSPTAEQFQLMNNPEVKKAIKSHLAFVKAKAAQRRGINGEISASRNGLVDRGLNRAAVSYLEQYAKMEDKHKHNMDATVIIGREAMGDPLDFDLFGKPIAKSKPQSKKKAGAKKGNGLPAGLSAEEVRDLCEDNDVPFDEADPGGSYQRLQAAVNEGDPGRTH